MKGNSRQGVVQKIVEILAGEQLLQHGSQLLSSVNSTVVLAAIQDSEGVVSVHVVIRLVFSSPVFQVKAPQPASIEEQVQLLLLLEIKRDVRTCPGRECHGVGADIFRNGVDFLLAGNFADFIPEKLPVDSVIDSGHKYRPAWPGCLKEGDYNLVIRLHIVATKIPFRIRRELHGRQQFSVCIPLHINFCTIIT